MFLAFVCLHGWLGNTSRAGSLDLDGKQRMCKKIYAGVGLGIFCTSTTLKEMQLK